MIKKILGRDGDDGCLVHKWFFFDCFRFSNHGLMVSRKGKLDSLQRTMCLPFLGYIDAIE